MTNRRISELADMLVMHIVHNRDRKALLIAQCIRHATGGAIVLIDRQGHKVDRQGHAKAWGLDFPACCSEMESDGTCREHGSYAKAYKGE
jgi:hypothetical protein